MISLLYLQYVEPSISLSLSHRSKSRLPKHSTVHAYTPPRVRWDLAVEMQSPVFLPPSSLPHQPSRTVTHTHHTRNGCTFNLGPIVRCIIPLYTTATATADTNTKAKVSSRTYSSYPTVPVCTCLHHERDLQCNAAGSHSRTVQHDSLCRARNCQVVCCVLLALIRNVVVVQRLWSGPRMAGEQV